MNIRRVLKKFHYGEKGFTLIELLVVVAILGILAAVIIPNVMSMMGEGTVQAANTEAHNVEIGVLAAMVDADVYALEDAGTVGPERTAVVADSDGNPLDVMQYITGSLEAEYLLDEDGHIADADGTGGKWKDLTYVPDQGWEEVP